LIDSRHSLGNPFAHQGLAYDAEISSYQNRHRQYAPKLKRFMQRDPLSSLWGFVVELHYLDGMSLYGYVRENPCATFDPTGTVGDDDIHPDDECDEGLENCRLWCQSHELPCLVVMGAPCATLCREFIDPAKYPFFFSQCVILCTKTMGSAVCTALVTECLDGCQSCEGRCVLSREPGDVHPDGRIDCRGPGTWPDDCPGAP